jgi:hypothetical protein
MAQQKRSPLKAAPLRVAGQGIQEALIDNAFDRLIAPALLAIMLALIALLEWVRYWLASPPVPWLYTAVAVGAAVWAALSFRRGMQQSRQLKLGRDGERAVAQYLEWFRTKDFFVFHDVPTGDANIDHLLIGTRGLYVIETKTLSKPLRGECRIRVSEQGVAANGRALDRNPMPQAKAQARWLYDFLAESGFKRFVQPVVVFPGWFVEPFDMKAAGVWVLEPKALDKFIEGQPAVLTPEQVGAMAAAVSSYIRSRSAIG